MRKPIQLLLVSLALGLGLLSGITAEAKVYKWVDKEGNVHYSDKPVNQEAEATNINDNPKSRANNVSAQNAQQRVDNFRKQIQSSQEEQVENDKKMAVQKEKNKALCAEAKKRLATLTLQRPVYKLDDEGERQYYSDEERAKTIAELEEQKNASCESE